MLEAVKKMVLLEMVKKMVILLEEKTKNNKFVCEYNGDTALRDGRVCGQ